MWVEYSKNRTFEFPGEPGHQVEVSAGTVDGQFRSEVLQVENLIKDEVTEQIQTSHVDVLRSNRKAKVKVNCGCSENHVRIRVHPEEPCSSFFFTSGASSSNQ